MPVITKIAKQKKRKERYAIYLDEVYAFSVEEDVLIAFQLTKGKILSETEIREITEKDGYSQAYSLALNYLSYRMRTVREMEIYLEKKEIPQIWLEKIIVKLLDAKLLNDTQFANTYVRDRIHQTTKGPGIIQRELAEKGIDPTIAEQALEQFDFGKQYERALKWLQKERQKTTRHAHRKHEEQLKAKLFQQGFDKAVIYDVFAHHRPEFDKKGEEILFKKQVEKLHRKHSKKFSGFELEMKLKTALFQRGFHEDMIYQYINELKAKERGVK